MCKEDVEDSERGYSNNLDFKDFNQLAAYGRREIEECHQEENVTGGLED
jgi:hypothetical protein